MTKHIYAVSLDKEMVIKSKERLESIGGKFSTLLNHLLILWLKEKQENDNQE